MMIPSLIRRCLPALLIVAASIPGFSAPVITSITPSTGATQGGNLITIVGTGFGLSPEIWVGSNEADPSTPSTDTLIIAGVPEGEGVDVPVTVVAGGVTSNSRPYSYLAPVINSITPATSGTAGGTQITISGSSFGSNPTATLGGVSISKISGSHSQFVGTLPAGQGINLPIVVRTSGGRLSNSVNFSYSPPSISSISPTSAATAGGSVITLTGSNFGVAGATVTVNGTNAPLVALSHSSVRVTLPPGQGNPATVQIIVEAQTASSTAFGYAAPVLSSISAASKPTAGGVAITLSGSNFGLSPSVIIGGVSATITGTPTYTQLVATLPPGQGTGNLVRVIAAGQVSNSLTLDYDAPVISSISAASKPTAGGVAITLSGSNFGLSPSVTIGGVSATVTGTPTHTQVVATLPPGHGTGKLVRVTAAAQVSNSLTLDYDAPLISSVTATSRPTAGNVPITLQGSNFGISPSVTLQGTQLSVIQSSHSSIVCTLPPGQGTRSLVVTASLQNSPFFSFSYDPPLITSLIPDHGPTAGNIAITLQGSNFGLSRTVTVGGLNAPITSGTHTQIVATLPPGAGASRDVVVTVESATSSAAAFSYDQPTLSTVSPTSGPTAGGTVITLTGSNFGPSPRVFVNGTEALIVSTSHSSIQFTLPPGQGLNQTILVDANGQTANTAAFSYAAPVLTSISATSKPTAGGVPITLTGSNFGLSRTVTIGGVSALVTGTPTHNQLVVTLPPGQGTGKLVTVNVAGQVSNSLTLDYDAPVISSVTAASKPTAGSVPITLQGSNFGTSPSVTLQGTQLSVIQSSHSSIVCNLPPGQGTRSLVVTAGLQTSSAFSFSYDPPLITSLIPDHGPTAGNIAITLQGSNFGLSRTVTVGGVNASVTSGTHTQIVATLPAGDGLSRNVLVNVDSAISNAVPFDYDPPSITSVSPTTGSTSGGTVITLTGNNFGLAPLVTVNNSAATLVSTGHSNIQFILPPGQGTNATIAVQANGQSATNQSFSYAAPLLSNVTATSRPTAGGVHLTLTGSNFGISPLVTVGVNNASIVGIPSHTQIIAMLPPGEGLGKSVTVVVAGQTSNSRLLDYDAPAVTEITAASIPTSGNVPITIRGVNFGLAPTATVGGSTIAITSSSHTQIVGTLPAGRGINRPLIVMAALQASPPFLLSYDPPVISSITPGTASTAGGTLLTIQGQNFGVDPLVSFGSQSITPISFLASHTQLVIEAPPGQGTDIPVRVSLEGRVSAPQLFSYAPPVLSSITPSKGPSAGGTTITLTGSSFGLSPTVTIGGVTVTSTRLSHSQVTAIVPAGEGTNRQVRVDVDGRSSNALSFSYDVPQITQINPTTGPTSGNVPITISGNSFGLNPLVTVGGNSASILSSTHSQIIATLPPGQGTGKAVVVNAANQLSAPVSFDYQAPLLTSVSAASVPTAGNVPITVRGENFGLTPIVTVGGRTAPLTSSSHTELIATLPAGEGIDQPVIVTVEASNSNSRLLSYDPPSITSITPASGPIRGNATITIHGLNFGFTPSVNLNGKTAPVTFASHNSIRCTLPAGNGQNRLLIVSAAGQDGSSTFSYDTESFADWAASISWGGLDSSLAADPRGNGFTNLESYAFGIDPLTANGGETASRSPTIYGKPAFSRDGLGRLQLSFWHRASEAYPDLSYQVQFGDSLDDPAWEPASLAPQVEVVDEVWEYRTYTDHSAAAGKRFGRVKLMTLPQ
jgi:large repetitive protein